MVIGRNLKDKCYQLIRRLCFNNHSMKDCENSLELLHLSIHNYWAPALWQVRQCRHWTGQIWSLLSWSFWQLYIHTYIYMYHFCFYIWAPMHSKILWCEIQWFVSPPPACATTIKSHCKMQSISNQTILSEDHCFKKNSLFWIANSYFKHVIDMWNKVLIIECVVCFHFWNIL